MADSSSKADSAGEMSRQSSMSERVEGMASWMAMSVIAAFFSSLERCSCINLSTTEDEYEEDEEEEEAKDRPLMLSRPTYVAHDHDHDDSVHIV